MGFGCGHYGTVRCIFRFDVRFTATVCLFMPSVLSWYGRHRPSDPRRIFAARGFMEQLAVVGAKRNITRTKPFGQVDIQVLGPGPSGLRLVAQCGFRGHSSDFWIRDVRRSRTKQRPQTNKYDFTYAGCNLLLTNKKVETTDLCP
jgi:hypothetical protein